MRVYLRLARLGLPLALVAGCAFDTKGVDLGDAVSAGDARGGADGGSGADGARDAAGSLDLGVGDVRDAGELDAASDAPTCPPQCSGKLCGAADGCGGTCQPGSGCCTPSCAGKPCGSSDGCGGTCQPGSGCCTPSCQRAVCGGDDGCGGTCHADHGDPCTTTAETWRCVWIDAYNTWGSQVCRSGIWQTYALGPRTCGACCGTFSPDCCANTGC